MKFNISKFKSKEFKSLEYENKGKVELKVKLVKNLPAISEKIKSKLGQEIFKLIKASLIFSTALYGFESFASNNDLPMIKEGADAIKNALTTYISPLIKVTLGVAGGVSAVRGSTIWPLGASAFAIGLYTIIMKSLGV